MKEFTGSLKFIVSFLILSIFIQMILGTKVLTGFMTLVLLGMVVVNSKEISDLIGKGFSQK